MGNNVLLDVILFTFSLTLCVVVKLIIMFYMIASSWNSWGGKQEEEKMVRFGFQKNQNYIKNIIK